MTDKNLEQKIANAVYSTQPPSSFDSILLAINRQEKDNEDNIMTTTKNKNIPFMKKILPIAASVAIMAGTYLGYQGYLGGQEVKINLDVNPSMQVVVNKKEEVKTVTPLNEDAQLVLADMNFEGVDLDVAMNAIVGSMIQNGFINNTQNAILVSVEGEGNNSAIKEAVVSEVTAILEAAAVTGSVTYQEVTPDEAVQQKAEELGVSDGKVSLINQIVASNPALTFEELQNLSIAELTLLAQSTQVVKPENVDVEGMPYTGDYITKDAATQAALNAAGQSVVTDLEVDYDTYNGILSYEVEFKVGETEYEYNIDARTGAVINFEIDTDNDGIWDDDDNDDDFDDDNDDDDLFDDLDDDDDFDDDNDDDDLYDDIDDDNDDDDDYDDDNDDDDDDDNDDDDDDNDD